MNIVFFDRVCPGYFEFVPSSISKSGSNNYQFYCYQYDSHSFDTSIKNIKYLDLEDDNLVKKPLLTLTHEEREQLKQQFVDALKQLPDAEKPDIIIANTLIGCTDDIKTHFPDCKLIGFFPFYANQEVLTGAVLDVITDDPNKITLFNESLDKTLQACDVGITFSHWQKQLLPQQYHDKIEVIPQGSLTKLFQPDKGMFFGLIKSKSSAYSLVGDHIYQNEDELVSYIAEGIEPMRKIDEFAQIAQKLLAARPNCKIAILSHRGGKLGPSDENLIDDIVKKYQLDDDRVHIQIPFNPQDQVNLYKCSSLHVYLSEDYPNAQSLYDAMGTGALVLASDTAPVREVINDQETGLLLKSNDVEESFQQISNILDNISQYDAIKNQAHKHIKKNYNKKYLLLSLVKRIVKLSVLGK